MKKIFTILFLLIIGGLTLFADLNDGLIAYYPFNGNANDESGNGYTGTVNSAILTTDRFGNENSAYNFDGNNDYIEPISKLPIDSFPISVNMWLNTNGPISNYQTLYTSDYNDSHFASYYGFWITHYNNRVYATFAQTAGTGSNATKGVGTEIPLPLNEWVMLTVIYENHDNIRRVPSKKFIFSLR